MSNSPPSNWKPLLGKLGESGMLIICGCYSCRRSQTYLASDLAQYFGAKAVVGELFPGCPYCDTGSSWYEHYRHASSNDALNGTIIRRLKGWRSVAIWQNEPYGYVGLPELPKLDARWEMPKVRRRKR